MRALVWHGKGDVRCDTVSDPRIEDPRDIIVKITSTAICGSDLHLYDHYMPAMEKGDILGHEPMGEVVELGSGITKFKKGDRVVIPFTICCGECFFCKKELWSCCDRTNRDKEKVEKQMGHAPAGLFGYSHLTGHYPGGQAEYLRVPYADVSPFKVENDSLTDEQVLFLSDIFPTGYMAAENAEIEPGDTVAVWGCGPVGQFCIQSAWMFGAGRVIAIDRVPERLEMARKHGRAETINFEKSDATVYERIQEMTDGRGADRCIDAVGAEAHGTGSFDARMDKAKASVFLATDQGISRFPRSRLVLPQRRNDFDARRLYRIRRQDSVRRIYEQGADTEGRADTRQALQPEAARQDRFGRNRPVIRSDT